MKFVDNPIPIMQCNGSQVSHICAEVLRTVFTLRILDMDSGHSQKFDFGQGPYLGKLNFGRMALEYFIVYKHFILDIFFIFCGSSSEHSVFVFLGYSVV